MTAIPLDRQISRVRARVLRLQSFMALCPQEASATRAEKQLELDEYMAVLATLIGLEAAQKVAA